MYKCICQFVSLWSSVCFSGTGSNLASYCLGEPSPHKAIIFKSLKSWIRYMTDDLPNCDCYSDCLLVLYLMVLYVLVDQTVCYVCLLALCLFVLFFGLSFVYRVACACGFVWCTSIFMWVVFL